MRGNAMKFVAARAALAVALSTGLAAGGALLGAVDASLQVGQPGGIALGWWGQGGLTVTHAVRPFPDFPAFLAGCAATILV